MFVNFFFISSVFKVSSILHVGFFALTRRVPFSNPTIVVFFAISLFLFSSGAEPAAEINVGTFVLFRALGVPSASQHSKIVFSFLDARHVTGGHARRQRLPVLVH